MSAKVSQLAKLPDSNPRLNHSTRCAEEPCVKLSGTTPRPASLCNRSSPIAEAAVNAVSGAFGPMDVAQRKRFGTASLRERSDGGADYLSSLSDPPVLLPGGKPPPVPMVLMSIIGIRTGNAPTAPPSVVCQ